MKIPKKYLMVPHRHSAKSLIRQWVYDGLMPRMLIIQLTEEYKGCRRERAQYLGELLTMAYDLEDLQWGRAVADKFGICCKEGYTASECAFLHDYQENDIVHFKQKFNESVILNKEIKPELSKRISRRVVPPADITNMLTLSSAYNVYALKHANGALTVLVLNDCNCDVLIDEEEFCDDAPLYFTEPNHFISPVHIVKIAAQVVEYVLRCIGYPPMPVNKKVLFTHPGCNFLNRENYVEDGEQAESWAGVEVRLAREQRTMYAFTDTMRWQKREHESRALWGQLDDRLLTCMSAAQMLFARLTAAFMPTFVTDDQIGLEANALKLFK